MYPMRTVLVLVALSLTLSASHAEQTPVDAAAISHALNRLTFGARPGDIEAVRDAGLSNWIQQQLTPVTMTAQRAAIVSLATRPSPRELRGLIAVAADAKLRRALTSERQLEEVLVDFWFNHFNVFAQKGPTALFLGAYEDTAIRPHVLGKFRDLLASVAKSPAMLIYLDNWQSDRRRGLNENYARELLELHTLGVDGGYSQEDVVNVARAFTGWTVARRGNAQFRFAANLHDRDPKRLLGRPLNSAGGIDDGERVLDIVAQHPATARHIALKLSQRFVSDVPPPSVVDRAARTFTDTGGDLRAVTHTIVTSREFFDPGARQAKIKTPLEFVLSALRASDADVRTTRRLIDLLAEMGMPLYLCPSPTGYDDAADAWVSAGAIVARVNFALALSRGEISGISTPAISTDLASTYGAASFQRQ
jgi:uncharacterized protein (DUF1800 family)